MIANNNAKEDIGFDLERAKECIDTYSNAINIQCIIINTEGEILYSNCRNSMCEICKSTGNHSEREQLCRNSHLYGSYQAERSVENIFSFALWVWFIGHRP